MKIADLDDSTRRLVFAAHVMARFPSNQRLRMPRRPVDQYDKVHESERNMSLLRAISGELYT